MQCVRARAVQVREVLVQLRSTLCSSVSCRSSPGAYLFVGFQIRRPLNGMPQWCRGHPYLPTRSSAAGCWTDSSSYCNRSWRSPASFRNSSRACRCSSQRSRRFIRSQKRTTPPRSRLVYQMMCLRAVPDAQRLSVELVVLVQVLQQQTADLPHGRIRLDGAGAQIRADLAENPGRPCAARPTMIASAPVASNTKRAFWGESTSPLATTGMRTALLDTRDRVVFRPARRSHTARAAVQRQHPGAGRFGHPRDSNPRCDRSYPQPVRNFSVTGTSTASTTDCTIRATSVSSRKQRGAARPPGRPCAPGQPMFRSMIWAPAIDVVSARHRPGWRDRHRPVATAIGACSPS